MAAATPPAVPIVPHQSGGGELGESLRREVEAAIDRGRMWLAAQQNEKGYWSNPDFPALTALPAQALIGGKDAQVRKALQKACDYIVSCVQPDGGIYRKVEGRKGGGLSNYNTAICMTTLHATGNPAYTPIVRDARRFVAGSQLFGDDVYRGGFGYDRDTGRAYTDLLNTFYAVQGMRLTQSVEDTRPGGDLSVAIDWDAARDYISRMQNRQDTGSDQAGGFFYKPGESKAGTLTNDAGRVFFRSYGSMTYAGLLALIYADVSRDDERVRSAFDWAARHWTLDENPGMGNEGLFFFYNVLARSLDAYGQDWIPTASGGQIDWRKQLAQRLVSLQKIDPATGGGYWINPNNRFWEADSILVTAYTLLALQAAL